jgi:hypothetical protein
MAGWTVPAVAVGGPGFLLILVVLLQFLGGAAWVAVMRRALAGIGLRRRRRRD